MGATVDAARERLEDASSKMGVVMQAFPSLLGREFGMSRSRLFALGRIGQSPCTQGEIADVTLSSASSASRLVDGLVADGLVERRRNPADGRAVLVALTAEGEALAVKLQERQLTILGTVIERLGTDAVDAAAAGLDLLLGALIDVLDREMRA